MQAKLKAFEKTRKPTDHLRNYREAITGGSAERGREIFFGRSEVSCRRCHKIDSSGGEVGPDLSRIGIDKNREYLLESIVDPNKQIAKGFETAIVGTKDGKVYAGIIKGDDGNRLRLQLPDSQRLAMRETILLCSSKIPPGKAESRKSDDGFPTSLPLPAVGVTL